MTFTDPPEPEVESTEDVELPPEEGDVADGAAKKKVNTNTLVMLGMVVAAIGATYFMIVRTGPATASASVETEVANQTISQFLNDKNKNLKAMQTMLRDTEQTVHQFEVQPSATQVPLSDLPTNPFRANAAIAKTDENEAALRRKRDADRAAAMSAVQGLTLQSVVYGNARRSCMVNGRFYGEGDSVEAFLIERINPKSVVVRRDVYRYEITMAHDQ